MALSAQWDTSHLRKAAPAQNVQTESLHLNNPVLVANVAMGSYRLTTKVIAGPVRKTRSLLLVLHSALDALLEAQPEETNQG